MRSLDGKHALVTGGGTGIGAAIAVVLSKEGAAVSLVGRRREPLEQTAAKLDRASVIVADVTDADSCAAMAADARARGRTQERDSQCRLSGVYRHTASRAFGRGDRG